MTRHFGHPLDPLLIRSQQLKQQVAQVIIHRIVPDQMLRIWVQSEEFFGAVDAQLPKAIGHLCTRERRLPEGQDIQNYTEREDIGISARNSLLAVQLSLVPHLRSDVVLGAHTFTQVFVHVLSEAEIAQAHIEIFPDENVF